MDIKGSNINIIKEVIILKQKRGISWEGKTIEHLSYIKEISQDITQEKIMIKLAGASFAIHQTISVKLVQTKIKKEILANMKNKKEY